MAEIADIVEQYISADTLEAKAEQWLRDLAACSWRQVEALEPGLLPGGRDRLAE